jgi:hypothetical protein
MIIESSSDALRLSGPNHHIVGANINRDQGLALHQNFKRDAIAQVDRARVQPFKAAPQSMKSYGRMVRIGFQKEQRFAIHFTHLGMAPQKTSGSAVYRSVNSNDQLKAASAPFAARHRAR